MENQIYNSLTKYLDQIRSQFPQAQIAISVKVPSYNFDLDINGDRIFHAASLMKVPLMIDLFKKISEGTLALSNQLEVHNRFHSIVDQSLYSITDDTDDYCYQFIGGQLTIKELIEQMIIVSSNLATNLLFQVTTTSSIQSTLERLTSGYSQVLRGVEDIKAFEVDLNNTMTAADITCLMEALLEGRAVSHYYDKMMVDILLAQQVEGMIPAGLPANCVVAHKTGEITKTHHDAGIIYPEHGAPIILAILTEGIEDQNYSTKIGSSISKTLFQHFCD